MTDWGGLLFTLCLYFVVPIALARGLMGATPRMLLKAYGIWFATLVVLSVLLGSKTAGEIFGWAMIGGMFLSIPGSLIIVRILKSKIA